MGYRPIEMIVCNISERSINHDKNPKNGQFNQQMENNLQSIQRQTNKSIKRASQLIVLQEAA